MCEHTRMRVHTHTHKHEEQELRMFNKGQSFGLVVCTLAKIPMFHTGVPWVQVLAAAFDSSFLLTSDLEKWQFM